MASGPQSGRCQGRRALQGGEGGVRDPGGREQACRLRPVRPRRHRSPCGARRGRHGRLRRHLQRHLRRDLRRGRRPRRALHRLSRRRPALQPRDHARAGGARLRDQDPHSGHDGLRDVQGHRRAARQPAADLPFLPRRRPGARLAGAVLDRPDLSALPRQREHHPQSLRELRRHRAREAAEDPFGPHPRRRRRGRPGPPLGRGRAGRERRPARGPLRAGAHQAASGLPARPRRSPLRDAHLHHHRGARRRDRHSHARRHRAHPRAGRDAVGQDLQAARQGHQGRSQPAAR